MPVGTRRRGRARTSAGAVIIPEKNVQSTIITFLNRAKILNNRVNGAQVSVSGENSRGNATKRKIRCSSMNGKADVEAWLFAESPSGVRLGIMCYIEVKKSHGGKQSDDQKTFQALMEERGYYYTLATSVKDVYSFFVIMKEDVEKKLPGWKLDIGRARIQ